MKPIDSFSGRYRFLSNFWYQDVQLDGVTYATVEHAYQAAKTLDPSIRQLVRMAGSPGQAKRMGNRIILRPAWDAVKLVVMLDLVRQKFQNSLLLTMELRNTFDASLIEGNHWGDTFWGVCNGKGENNLGKILERVRAELPKVA